MQPHDPIPTRTRALPAVLRALMATALLASPALADRHVAVSGSDVANDCTDPGLPCATIPFAVGLATPGEVVSIGAGSFAGSVGIGKPLTLRGAQAGIAVAGRTAGSAAETIVDVRGLGTGVAVSSGDVVIEGLEILGDAQTWAGIVLYANADLPNVTVRDSFVHGMALANPNSSFTHFAYGIFGITGVAGDRRQISSLVVQGNDIYDLGADGSVAGAGVYLHNVAGAAPGAGATITGNLFRDLATRDAALNRGVGIVIDAGADDFIGIPTGPSSGVAVSGNTYVNSTAGAALFAANSSFGEPSTSFANVPALVINIFRQATIDTLVLGRFVSSNALTGLADSDGYFSTIQSAADASASSAELRPTAHVFAETVTLSRGLQLLGPRAGEDARTRDPLLGEATVSLGIRIRAEGATVDGVTVTNPGATAVHADQTATSATVRNTRVATALRGIALDRAQNAVVTQNLVQDIGDDAIAAGSDNGTVTTADDVASIAVVQDNETVNANVGVNGYMHFSIISRNVFRDYPDLDLGAGIAGALLDSTVELNTVSNYPRGAGILLTGNPNRPLTRDTVFKCNSFLDNYFGILIEITQTTAEGILVRGNTISGNTIGALNYPPFLLDASNNWWGCAAGPGNAGCDIAGQGIDYEPFLTATPDCATCTLDTDCDDGLFCNGAESCDPLIEQCLPGAAPECDLGSADPQCNVATCDQLFGCVAIPVSDGTTCDLGTPCSAVETCVTGACVAGPGAEDDDGDGICNADDTCPSCDFPLSIEKARLVRNSGNLRKNGKVVVKATFIAPIGSPHQFDLSGPISILVRDGGDLAVDAAFLSAECKSRRNIVTCKSADRRFSLRVKPFRPRDNTGQQILNATLKGLDIGPSFEAPVTVLLRHGAGISRTGSISGCKTAPGLLRCP
jgi:nitrous oxidase accessory protein NosD